MTSAGFRHHPDAYLADGGQPAGSAVVRPSQIVVLVPSDRTRAWALHLTEVIPERFGLRTVMAAVPGLISHPPVPSEDLEVSLLRAPRRGPAAWVRSANTAPVAIPWADCLVINATGHDPRDLPAEMRSGMLITPLFHGQFRMEAMAAPLLAGEPPHLGVLGMRGETAWLMQGAWLAPPERTVMRRALNSIFGRTITLLLGATDQLISGRRLPEPSPPPAPAALPAGLRFWSRQLTAAGLPKLGRRLARPFLRRDWCVGYRRLAAGSSPIDPIDPASFRMLDAGPDRYFADPFVMRHDDLTVLFFEDYRYEAQRGRISYVVLRDDGSHTAPAEALTRPYHLSYPFLLSEDGVALMAPETGENRTIELYEARRFPHEWRLRSVLIDNIDASDSTLHFDERTGLWWMFSTVTEFGSSSHDTLSIFFSERLDGPWRPHRANPVKFDARSSRPAGPVIRWNGRLLRPTQDCSRGYGGGLAWCEIQELTPDAFREEVVARHPPPRGHTALHTYGRAAGIEVADFDRTLWRFRGAGERRPSSHDLPGSP